MDGVEVRSAAFYPFKVTYNTMSAYILELVVSGNQNLMPNSVSASVHPLGEKTPHQISLIHSTRRCWCLCMLPVKPNACQALKSEISSAHTHGVREKFDC